MKNIIIPYLESNASLEIFRLSLQLYPEQVNVCFLEINNLPDNYNDLVTLPRNHQHHFKDAQFIKEVQELRASNISQVQSVSFEHIYGTSAPVFRNFALSKEASIVMYYDNGTQKEITKMLLRSKMPLLYINKMPVTTDVLREVNDRKTTVPQAVPVMAKPAGEWHEPGKPVVHTTGNSIAQSQKIPDSIVQQFNMLDNTLTTVFHQLKDNLFCTRKLNYLQRYFLTTQKMGDMLRQEKRQMLLLM